MQWTKFSIWVDFSLNLFVWTNTEPQKMQVWNLNGSIKILLTSRKAQKGEKLF